MSLSRRCSRTACSKPAIATLTYVYGDQTAVVGPLATFAEPHTYDLCATHAEGLTAPRGWEIVRLSGEYVEPEPSHDDLLALANAVREAGRPRLGEAAGRRARAAGRRGCLRRDRDRPPRTPARPARLLTTARVSGVP